MKLYEYIVTFIYKNQIQSGLVLASTELEAKLLVFQKFNERLFSTTIDVQVEEKVNNLNEPKVLDGLLINC